MIVVVVVAAFYGMGLSFFGMNVFFDDIPVRERLIILGLALTWPVSIPVVFVIDELWWRYRFRKWVRNSLKRAERK